MTNLLSWYRNTLLHRARTAQRNAKASSNAYAQLVQQLATEKARSRSLQGALDEADWAQAEEATLRLIAERQLAALDATPHPSLSDGDGR